MSFPLLLFAGAAINAAAAAAALWRGALTPGGAAAGFLVGTLIFSAGGPFFWLVMGAFFLSGTILSRIGKAAKEGLAQINEKGDRRDSVQVLANGGVAALMAVLYRLSGEPAFAVGFAVAFASANADTWASEVGVLARTPPVSLLTLRPVQAGISGGVSLLGTAASLGGSLLIALLFIGVQGIGARTAGAVVPPSGRAGLPVLAAVVAACGFFGSLVDSLLGASLQARYAVPGTGVVTEQRSSAAGPHTLVAGIRAVTNDVVNLASTAAAAAAGMLFYRLLA